MSRSWPRLWLCLTLALLVGVALGVALDRGGPFLAAQATHPHPTVASAERPEPVSGGSAGPSRAGDAEAQVKPGSDDDLYRQLDEQYQKFHHINRTFEMVARAVAPSVVHIVASKRSRAEDTGKIRYFDETGSGVIVRGDHSRSLYVLTNNHVIEGAQAAKISIFLHDGRAIHPDRYWLDRAADIAVLNLGRTDLPAARLGNSEETAVGTWVLALGSPFGLTHSVSQGIISARSRHVEELQDVENQDFLQTDAAINPGNSGGPLVNLRGEVIGINNSIASNGGGNEGVGFSIPINLARWIMNQLISNGRVSRGALGIDLHPVFRPEDAIALGLERPQGAWIDRVHPGSPAARGGLRSGDLIVRFNGVEINDLNHLINVVSMAAIGQEAEVVVWRGRKLQPFRVMVGERDRALAEAATPEPPAPTAAGGLLRRNDRPGNGSSFALGLELVTLDPATSRRLGLPESLRGAAIVQIVPESPVASLFKPLDVIHSVDGRSISSAEEATRALSRASGRESLLLGFARVVQGAVERRSIRVP
jgi:serine protease Do